MAPVVGKVSNDAYLHLILSHNELDLEGLYVTQVEGKTPKMETVKSEISPWMIGQTVLPRLKYLTPIARSSVCSKATSLRFLLLAEAACPGTKYWILTHLSLRKVF